MGSEEDKKFIDLKARDDQLLSSAIDKDSSKEELKILTHESGTDLSTRKDVVNKTILRMMRRYFITKYRSFLQKNRLLPTGGRSHKRS